MATTAMQARVERMSGVSRSKGTEDLDGREAPLRKTLSISIVESRLVVRGVNNEQSIV